MAKEITGYVKLKLRRTSKSAPPVGAALGQGY